MPITPLKGLVYVAGPMTLGVRQDNLNAAMEAGSALLRLGWTPIMPQLSYDFVDKYKFTWEQMLAADFCIILNCVAIIRLPGESKGADAEEEFTRSLGKPVYYSVLDFIMSRC